MPPLIASLDLGHFQPASPPQRQQRGGHL